MKPEDYIVPGFDVSGICGNIKETGRRDVALITSRVPCRVAATFTQNSFPAAPVIYDRRLLEFNPDAISGVIINSGFANACTGVEGDANARLTAEAVEQNIGSSDNTVHIMSTGVIGVQLPMDRLLAAVPEAVAALRPDGWTDAAQAILTTDTRPKLVSIATPVAGAQVRFTGIAKGSGMIHPDMATMLSVIATDANISQPLLQQALNTAITHSFNCISVDGDTSTNDTVLLLANGLANSEEIEDAAEVAYSEFVTGLTAICTDLSQSIVRDGEGATKFVTIRVQGAISDTEAHQAANTIAISPLVKTAFYGSDANWGRLLMAVGRSGIQVDPMRCSLYVTGGPDIAQRQDELQLVQAGQPTTYAEKDAAARFAEPEIDVRVDLGLGDGSATVWTTDLSHEYVTINGDYRT